MSKKVKLNSRKLVAIGLTALILLGSSLAVLALNNSRKDQPAGTSSVTAPKKEEAKKEDSSFDFAMVGDMLPHDTVNQAAKQTDGSFDYLSLISPELQQSFKKADLRFCNQESPSAAQISTQGYPAFNAPIKFPEDISSFGCCLLYTSDAADERSSVDLGGRRIIKKKTILCPVTRQQLKKKSYRTQSCTSQCAVNKTSRR